MNVLSLGLADKTVHQQQNYYPSKAKALRLSLQMIIVSALVATSGCLPEDKGKVVDNEAALGQQRKQNMQEIKNSIDNSYALLAARRADICPKLLQKDVDTNVIERVQEVMVDDYCEYYLYPKVDQRITVELSDDKIEALLVVPELHNFADGDYKVLSYDKHVIRLAYNGATYKPEHFMYDVVIKLID